MYILLRKGKDFYYECAGRCTEKPPNDRGFYDYEHACFTLDGQVLNLNKTDASLSHCLHSTDHQKQSRNI